MDAKTFSTSLSLTHSRKSFLCTWDSWYQKIATILLSLRISFAFHIFCTPSIHNWHAPWGLSQFTHFHEFVSIHGDLFHIYSHIVMIFGYLDNSIPQSKFLYKKDVVICLAFHFEKVETSPLWFISNVNNKWIESNKRSFWVFSF